MMRSLFAAVSGLRNHQLSMSVIGNNIANINTIGFKGGRALFQEMLSQTIQGASAPSANAAGSNPVQVGLGMSVGSISSSFTQGQLQLTGNQMDMAVQGEGFFVMRGGNQQFFGRSGAFGFDGDGRLTAGQGLLVQGWMADETGQIGSGTAIGDIVLPFGQTTPARATTRVNVASNLDASAEALSTVLESNRFLALGLSTDSLDELFNSRGQSLGIQAGDALTVRYSATPQTRVVDLATESGAPIDISNGDDIVIGDGSSTVTIPFNDSWTLEQFATEIQNQLAGLGGEVDIIVTVNSDGSLNFNNPAGGNNTDVTVNVSSAGSDVFNSLIASIPVINGTTTARSEETWVHQTITVGTTFTNMADFASSVEGIFQLGSPDATVSFVDGRLQYSNIDATGAAFDLNNITIERPGATTAFTEAMGLLGSNMTVNSTTQSDRLLDLGTESDQLIDLYDAQGNSLGLSNGDVFTFDAREGGNPLSQTTMSIVNTGDGSNADRLVQTLGGLMTELENVLELSTAGGITLTDGTMTVEGKSGLSHELTDLVFNESNNPVFGEAFTLSEIQAATDVVHESSIRVFDSLGNDHLLGITFTKDNDSENRWEWEVNFPEGEVLAGGVGTVEFNGDGSLASFASLDSAPLRLDPASGANGPLEIVIDAGARGGIDGITGFARESTASIVEQDGFAMGTLESISVDGDGVITGSFTNGTARSLAQMALASFKNPSGLQKDGRNGWMSTTNSGEGVVRRPGAGSEVGSISAGTLEMSNVDIAQEFTSMIIAQRGFQANARTVTTSDEMLVELVNLKR